MAGLINTLYLTAALGRAVIDHAQAELPREACGILAGVDRPTRHIPMANVEPSCTRFAFDATEQLAVYQQMDDRGEEPLVIYHSHPRAAAYPSAVDILYADPTAHYLIVSLRAEPELRAFRIVAGQVVEEQIMVDADARPGGFGG